MADTLDFYSLFDDGENIPFIEISKRSTDKFENFKEGVTTYDSLSYKYYGNSLNGIIISMANPQYVNELMIDDGVSIRIPFPVSDIIKEIQQKVILYKSL